jgi:hypothetical protein
MLFIPECELLATIILFIPEILVLIFRYEDRIAWIFTQGRTAVRSYKNRILMCDEHITHYSFCNISVEFFFILSLS